MIITDVLGIIALILIFVAYMIVSPMFEGNKKGNKGGAKVLDGMAKKIKDLASWVNRQ